MAARVLLSSQLQRIDFQEQAVIRADNKALIAIPSSRFINAYQTSIRPDVDTNRCFPGLSSTRSVDNRYCIMRHSQDPATCIIEYFTHVVFTLSKHQVMRAAKRTRSHYYTHPLSLDAFARPRHVNLIICCTYAHGIASPIGCLAALWECRLVLIVESEEV